MTAETHTELASFIWSICNLLRGPYKRNEYRKVTRCASLPSMYCFGGGRVLAASGPLWPRSSQSCRWAGLSTCRIIPAILHQEVGCGVAWALRLRGGCCDSRRSPCRPAASESRAQEPGKGRGLSGKSRGHDRCPNPQSNPQFSLSYTTSGYLGSPRTSISRCKTY